MQGHIVKIISNRCDVIADDTGIRQTCQPAGRLRLADSPVVGDRVEFSNGTITAIYPRFNQLVRPAIANIDLAMVVMSAVDPDFSAVLVDRLLFLICYQNINPVIVVTKMDLARPGHPVYDQIKDYTDSGYQVIQTGRDLQLDDIEKVIAGKIVVLAGQSGVGKSSLLNRLNPEYAIATQNISKALGRGKHTTRHSELYPVSGGWLADTPGFSSLDFSRVDTLTLAHRIRDFQTAGPCRFADCKHLQEPGCAVKKGVADKTISATRYQDYVDVTALCNKVEKWEAGK